MNCQDRIEMSTDYLSGNLEEGRRREFEAHLEDCEACRKETAAMKTTWENLEKLPQKEPSPQMRHQFYRMLEEEKRLLKASEAGKTAGPRESVWDRFDRWLLIFWPKKPGIQFGVTFAVLLLGLWLGGKVQTSGIGGGETARLRSEVQDLREFMSLSLMNQSSSVSRMQGVSLSTRVRKPDATLLEALLDAVQSDPSVNVRLAAVDALYLFRNQEPVQERLTDMLETQDFPLVQVALIDLVTQMREQRALDALKTLIGKEDVDPDVKAYAEQKKNEMI